MYTRAIIALDMSFSIKALPISSEFVHLFCNDLSDPTDPLRSFIIIFGSHPFSIPHLYTFLTILDIRVRILTSILSTVSTGYDIILHSKF